MRLLPDGKRKEHFMGINTYFLPGVEGFVFPQTEINYIHTSIAIR